MSTYFIKKKIAVVMAVVILLFAISANGADFNPGFPILGLNPFSPSVINSVFDLTHDSGFYNSDGFVRAYTGETGAKAFGEINGCYEKDSFGNNFVLSGNYRGAYGKQYLCYDGHPGVDFNVNGVQVLAVEEGTVIDLKNDAPDQPNLTCNCFGNFIKIKHGEDFISIYGHLKKGSITKQKGDSVTKGEQIAVSGNSGMSTGPHLHFELRQYTANGVIRVDPYSFWVTPPGIVNLPKTGQTKCYDSAGTEINCVGTGQDGEIRAGIPWPDSRFTITYCDSTGPCPDQNSDCDNNPSTDVVIDNLTGLMWTRDGNLPGSYKTWYEALEYSNNLSLCGHSDWQLPNVNELESLINADPPDTSGWLNNQGYTNVQSGPYWSSTTYAYETDYAWFVSICMDGYVSAVNKDYGSYVWSVRADTAPPAQIWKTGQKTNYATGDDGDLERGVAWPSPRFTDHGNGTVTDNLTGLIWLKDANCIKTKYPSFDNDWTSGDGEVTWQHALDFVKGINNSTYSNCSAGQNDWRLPNRKELRSLIDYSHYNPALPSDYPFTNVQLYYYWSSTSFAYWTGMALKSAIFDGGVDGSGKDYYGIYVWPVRGGTVNTYSISGTVFYCYCVYEPKFYIECSPVLGATVNLNGTESKTTTTDINGNYIFTDLSNGTYTVSSNGVGSKTVTIDGADVTADLSPNSTDCIF